VIAAAVKTRCDRCDDVLPLVGPHRCPRHASSPPHNPDIETQLPGCCVRDEARGVWLAAPPQLGFGLRWSTNPREAHVFAATTAAFQASMMGCIVTSVPRWTGHCLCWERV
jgi:hypothetical protein